MARPCHASELAGGVRFATAITVGASAAAFRAARAVHVARRGLTLEGTIAARAAVALAVAAAALTMIVVPSTRDVTRRRVATEVAVRTLIANALTVGAIALVVVTAAGQQQRQEAEQKAKAVHQANRTL